MLRLLGISLRVAGHRVLDEVSLQVRAGELVVVEGGRGAGKSVLARVAAALRRPEGGELWIGERDVAGLQDASLPYVRRNIGFHSDDVPLLPRMTSLENVMLAAGARGYQPAQARELALRALGRVGAASAATRLPETLSTSETRLVALARALAGAPPLVVLDDPAAGLAAGDAGAVLSAMLGACEAGAAALCTSPDGAFATAVVRAGGRRVRLEGGRVLAGGGPIGIVAARRPPAPPPLVRVEALP
jgi:cell division transport system ATP-binding protein